MGKLYSNKKAFKNSQGYHRSMKILVRLKDRRGNISPEENVFSDLPQCQSHFCAAADLHNLRLTLSSGRSNDMMGS